MFTWSPLRRMLGLPACFWVLLPFPLFWLASQLHSFWVPPKLPEPSLRAEIFRDGILVASDEESFRFVSLGEHKAVKPLWSVNVGLGTAAKLLGKITSFIQACSVANRLGLIPLPHTDSIRIGGETNPFDLAEPELRQLRPLVVAELNRRQPTTRDVDRLETLLNQGLREESFVCPQNCVVLLVWLSVPLALVGQGVMFLKPRRSMSGS